MPERTVSIGSKTGLHARPAKLFVQAATKAATPVRIRHGEREVDARSMLGVLSLGAKQGAEVTIKAEGNQAESTLDELAAMLAADLDAEEPAEPAAAKPVDA
jgi:phosphocarrier protein HPr